MSKQTNKQNPMEVYYRFDSTDCDQMATSRAVKFTSEAEAEKYIDSFYDNAEGQAMATPLSEDEYINFKGTSFDHAAYQAGY